MSDWGSLKADVRHEHTDDRVDDEPEERVDETDQSNEDTETEHERVDGVQRLIEKWERRGHRPYSVNPK